MFPKLAAPSTPQMNRKHHYLILAMILILGFVLRIWGIQFGLPHLYHADEPALVNHAIAHGSGDLNPHYFKLPPLVGYYLFFLYGIYFLLGMVVGKFDSPDAFALLFLKDPSSFYLIGRICTGLFLGVLGIYLVYRIASRLISKQGGLIAAFLLSVSFLHVRDSHYVIYDMPLTTGLTACFFALMAIIRKGKLRHYVYFGILGGITTAAKYNGALIGLPFLVAHFMGVRSKSRQVKNPVLDKYLITGLFTMGLFYALGNPFSLIDFKTFWQEFYVQASNEGHVGFLHHFRYSLTEGISKPLLIVSLIGTAYATLSKDPRLKVLSVFIILWIVYMGTFTQYYERYALPVIPFLCIAATLVIKKVYLRIDDKWKTPALLILTGVICFQSLAASIYVDMLFAKEDTRTIAKNWIENNLPENAKIALDYSFNQPRLQFNDRQLRQKYAEVGGPHAKILRWRLDLLLKDLSNVKRSYEIYYLADGSAEGRPLFAKPILPFDFEKVKAKDLDYVLIARLTPVHEHQDFYDQVKKNGELIKVISPYKDPGISYGLATIRQTAAATEKHDLYKRARFGDIIEIYSLKGDS